MNLNINQLVYMIKTAFADFNIFFDQIDIEMFSGNQYNTINDMK